MPVISDPESTRTQGVPAQKPQGTQIMSQGGDRQSRRKDQVVFLKEGVSEAKKTWDPERGQEGARRHSWVDFQSGLTFCLQQPGGRWERRGWLGVVWEGRL